MVTGNTSVNRGSGTRLAVADAVLDVCVYYYYYCSYYDDSDMMFMVIMSIMMVTMKMHHDV